MARLARRAAFIMSVLVATSFLVSAAQPTAQDFPSQVAPPAGKPTSGFLFPEQLRMFADLETYADGVLHGVGSGNFSSANASLANYSTVVNGIYTWWLNSSLAQAYGVAGLGNATVLSSMTRSQTLYSELIVKSERYEALYAASTSGANSSNGNQTVQNAVVMKGLSADIKTLRDQINATNDVIFGPAVAEGGLDMSDYAIAQGTLDAYVASLDSQLTNVTNAAFANTTTTIFLDHRAARYADYVHINGTVTAAQTGVANSTVTIMGRANPIATVQANAMGGYDYDYFVDGGSPGLYAIRAHYEPMDQPYKASNSSNVTLSVENVTATNTLRANGGSLLGNGITLTGTVATDREPVRNATVALYVGGKAAAYAESDANGSYHMKRSVSLVEYLGSLFQPSGETYYTVFVPIGHPLSEAKSDVITEPLLGTYVAASGGSPVGIAATATVLLAAALAVYVRVARRVARRLTATQTATLGTEALLSSSSTEALPVGLESSTGIAQETRHNVEDVIDHVKHCAQARDYNDAIIAAYYGALALITQAVGIAIKPSLSHWERYAVIEKRVPDARAFRELTYLYELASYSGREMIETRVEMALKDLTAIDGLGRGTGGET